MMTFLRLVTPRRAGKWRGKKTCRKLYCWHVPCSERSSIGGRSGRNRKHLFTAWISLKNVIALMIFSLAPREFLNPIPVLLFTIELPGGFTLFLRSGLLEKPESRNLYWDASHGELQLMKFSHFLVNMFEVKKKKRYEKQKQCKLLFNRNACNFLKNLTAEKINKRH